MEWRSTTDGEVLPIILPLANGSTGEAIVPVENILRRSGVLHLTTINHSYSVLVNVGVYAEARRLLEEGGVSREVLLEERELHPWLRRHHYSEDDAERILKQAGMKR